ncbi:hypothetical protein CFC21_105176 [Triticum aestivum]|uniref:F-box domain-containing protein n=2 Tax=Triticum aestivum TaxID=4565 RepID=A0A9R1MBE8_WHEAT|nr:hypothetical protein CFC21_105174 [Triticum aestivum]KAF7104268.1 hypothetical protein CFC21_105176 [Triticum aestivum]
MASPAMLPSLPDDLISEILSWVPVKSACRFCCVSRGWHALISGPAFVAMHRSRTDPQLLLLAVSYHRKEGGGISGDLQLVDVDGEVMRVNKSVGVFWTICYGRDDAPDCVTFDFREPSDFFVAKVINPVTGSVLMATTELDDGASSEVYIGAFKVGCAAPSGAYKVVRLRGNNPHQPWKVLTLGDGANWRQVGFPAATQSTRYDQGSVVTINGVMHFLYTSVTSCEDYIFRLDLESEKWMAKLKGPTSGELQTDVLIKYLVRFNNDTLCLVQSEEHLNNNVCTNIWLLSDHAKGTWVKAYTVSADSRLLIPLRTMRDSPKMLLYGFSSCKATSALQVYDPLTGTCTDLVKFEHKIYIDVLFCDLECFVSRKSSLVGCRLNPYSFSMSNFLRDLVGMFHIM